MVSLQLFVALFVVLFPVGTRSDLECAYKKTLLCRHLGAAYRKNIEGCHSKRIENQRGDPNGGKYYKDAKVA
ncbi:hypothetical protein Q1695_003787 [Nippostrongylus brasiliensis]|nr:hypothetical protein Q1695_003787 [Nippostrongylus brasiliensis]